MTGQRPINQQAKGEGLCTARVCCRPPVQACTLEPTKCPAGSAEPGVPLMSWVGFQSKGRAWWSSFRFLSTRAELRHKGSILLTKLKALMVCAGKEPLEEVRLLDKQIREFHSAASVKCVGSARELLRGVTALRWLFTHTPQNVKDRGMYLCC